MNLGQLKMKQSENPSRFFEQLCHIEINTERIFPIMRR